MRRNIIILFFLLSGALHAFCQNNPYEIDDECYAYFDDAEHLVGKEGFDEASMALFRIATEKHDKKAITLYYVVSLKNATKSVPRGRLSTDEEDAEVLRKQADLKTIADKYGYMQYFYYSYELVQSYFYSHYKPVRTMEVLQEMQNIAISRGDQYGEWQSYHFLATLYIAQSDYISAKKYLKKSLDIYDSTEDPLIRKQSMARLYCDLSDTYNIGDDSVKININRAVAASQVHQDTLRCEYYLAKLSAFEKRKEDYRRHRDYCMNDRSISTISRTATVVLSTLDAIIDGTFGSYNVNDLMSNRVREVKYIANVAEVYGYTGQAFELEKLLVHKFETNISQMNNSRLSEIDANLGNTLLSAELQHKQQVIALIMRIVAIIGIVIVTIMLIILLKKQIFKQ